MTKGVWCKAGNVPAIEELRVWYVLRAGNRAYILLI